LKFINKKKEKLISLISDQLTKDSSKANNPSTNLNLTSLSILNLAIGNFHSPLDQIKKRTEISNKALKILYKVWKQRSETAIPHRHQELNGKKQNPQRTIPHPKMTTPHSK
jgi:hypothetical protein